MTEPIKAATDIEVAEMKLSICKSKQENNCIYEGDLALSLIARIEAQQSEIERLRELSKEMAEIIAGDCWEMDEGVRRLLCIYCRIRKGSPHKEDCPVARYRNASKGESK